MKEFKTKDMDDQKKIEKLNKDFKPYIRIYQYCDMHMGYGDCGTVNFFKVEKDFFETRPMFPYYQIKPEIVKLLNIDFYSNGYEFVNKDVIQKTYDDNLKSIEKLKKQNKWLNTFLSK